MITAGLVQHLSSNEGVAALVSRNSLVAIYPGVIPTKTPYGTDSVPALTYRLISTQRSRTYLQTIGLVRSRIEINSFARTLTEAAQLAAAVRVALTDFAGAMGDTAVRDVSLEDESVFEDLEPGLYRVLQQFVFWHEE